MKNNNTGANATYYCDNICPYPERAYPNHTRFDGTPMFPNSKKRCIDCPVVAERNAREFEQLANNWCDSLVECAKASEQVTQAFRNYSNTILHNLVLTLIHKIEYTCQKYAKASFLTRWYWKRRINKLYSDIEELNKILNEQ